MLKRLMHPSLNSSRKGRGADRLFVTLATVLTFVCFLPWHANAIVPTIEKPIAVLRALDKITARVQELNVPLNQSLSFGNLTIQLRTCRVTPPEEQPEAAAFMDVTETKPDAGETSVFHGWMFASSPALSAMEHPVYDIWLIGCKDVVAKDATTK